MEFKDTRANKELAGELREGNLEEIMFEKMEVEINEHQAVEN